MVCCRFAGWDKDLHYVVSTDFFQSVTKQIPCGNLFEIVAHKVSLSPPFTSAVPAGKVGCVMVWGVKEARWFGGLAVTRNHIGMLPWRGALQVVVLLTTTTSGRHACHHRSCAARYRLTRWVGLVLLLNQAPARCLTSPSLAALDP